MYYKDKEISQTTSIQRVMKYSNAKIYLIRNKINGHTYIGATIQELEHHLLKKYEMSKQSNQQNYPLSKEFKEHGFENFTIELLQNFPCETVKELNEEKANYIKEYQPFLNKLKFLTRSDWDKKYRENNSEKLRTLGREYYWKNKDTIAEKEKETMLCHCGRTVNKRKLKRHQQSHLCKKLI